ncbi:MAG: hypothetical protein ACHQAX_07595 [Gammaproteobacteria bacterium]
MMKKLMLVVLTTSLWFSQAQALDNYGFYVGLEGIATKWELETETYFNDPFAANDTHYNDEGWDYGALARLGGYLRWGPSDRLFTAIEFFGEPHDIYFEHTNGTPGTNPVNYVQQKTEATYSLGGQLKQGAFLSEKLLGFLTAGLVYTQYKSLTTFISNTDPNHNVFASHEDKFYLPGFRLGVGMELFVIKNLGFDVQGAYIWYQDKNLSAINQQPNHGVPLGKVGETHFSPSELQLGVGVNFYF